jgi:hypothetical protein
MAMIGDVIRIRGSMKAEHAALIIDDCFRITSNKCTMLVRLLDTLEEVEVDVQDIIPTNNEE